MMKYAIVALLLVLAAVGTSASSSVNEEVEPTAYTSMKDLAKERFLKNIQDRVDKLNSQKPVAVVKYTKEEAGTISNVVNTRKLERGGNKTRSANPNITDEDATKEQSENGMDNKKQNKLKGGGRDQKKKRNGNNKTRAHNNKKPANNKDGDKIKDSKKPNNSNSRRPDNNQKHQNKDNKIRVKKPASNKPERTGQNNKPNRNKRQNKDRKKVEEKKPAVDKPKREQNNATEKDKTKNKPNNNYVDNKGKNKPDAVDQQQKGRNNNKPKPIKEMAEKMMMKRRQGELVNNVEKKVGKARKF